MGLSIHKPGQGYYTRMLSAAGFGALILAGAGWLYAALSAWQTPPFGWPKLYVQAGGAAVVILGFGALLFWLMNKPNIVDFMIATEAEMKKVHWPTKRQIFNNTMVVIIGTLILVFFLTLFDLGFSSFFKGINLLEG